MRALSHGATWLTIIWCMTSSTILLVLHVKHCVRDNEYLRGIVHVRPLHVSLPRDFPFLTSLLFLADFEKVSAWTTVVKIYFCGRYLSVWKLSPLITAIIAMAMEQYGAICKQMEDSYVLHDMVGEERYLHFYSCALLCSPHRGRVYYLHGWWRDYTKDPYYEGYCEDANLRLCQRLVGAESLPSIHDLHVHEL